MTRKTFLSVTSCIGLLVAVAALGFPTQLLASKGIAATSLDPVVVWVREVGAMIAAWSLVGWFARDQPDSPLMRAFLFGNAALHTGLLPIEIMGAAEGVVTKVGGIVPNSVLHVLLASAFVGFGLRVR